MQQPLVNRLRKRERLAFPVWIGLIACAIGGLNSTDVVGSDAEFTIETMAGTGQSEDIGGDGLATQVNIGWPFGVELGPDSALYVTECINHRILRVDLKSGRSRVIAGTGAAGYSPGELPARDAELNQPYEVRFDRDGNLYVVEMQNHVVRRIDRRSNVISTIAGTGEKGFEGDGGPGTAAELNVPHSIVLDAEGNIYIADIGNHRIRRVDSRDGTIETIAGTGEVMLPAEGAIAGDSPLAGPRALAIVDRTLWVVLREGHSLWTIALDDGTLQHVAGTGEAGYSGDGGPAIEATFNGPKGLAFDAEGNIYVVDSENDAIRRIDHESGMVTTIAGVGRARKFSGDGGDARLAEMSQPHGICVGPDGTIYVADTLNHRVRAIRSTDQ